MLKGLFGKKATQSGSTCMPGVNTPLKSALPGRFSNENRRVRVFVSSTFRDMMEERDELMAQTWPELRRFCRERQVEFVEVDLRWGISEAQSSRKETLKICLDETFACRPFFVGLLGERYGSVLPDGAFTADLEEEQPWVKELRDRSVTELEILHGVLRNPEMADRALFYFRDPAYAQGRGPDFLPDSPTAAERQAALKESIRRACHEKGILLRENYPNPRSLAEMVQADLEAVINARFPIESIPDPLDREARDHEAFAEVRRRVYIGRQEYFDALNRHALAKGGPLVLVGESGSGKSALLANWVKDWREAHPGDFIFQHYIGSTPGSADHWGLLNRLLAEIKRWTADPTDLPTSHDAILKDLPVWLARLRSKAEHDGARAIVILDALNQLEDRDGARLLGWLPDAPFTGSLRLIVSSLPGDTLEAVEKRGWICLRVQSLTPNERRRMVADYLARFTKKLDSPRVDRIVDAPATANPLYLKILLDELRVTGTHEGLDKRLDDYLSSDDIPSLLEKILARYESAYERDRPGLVRETLALIWAARRGLSEPELLALLRPPNLPQLPPALWAPLRAALDESLVDRGGILNFAHDFLRAAVERRYAASEERQQSLRLRLADYFDGLPVDARASDELPWLLQQAQARDRLRDCLLDLERFLEIRERDQQELLGYWLWLGEAEAMGARYEAAFGVWERGGKAGVARERLAFVANELGVFLSHSGQYTSAEPLYRRALAEREQALGSSDPATLDSANNLATLLDSKGDYPGAELLYRRAMEGFGRRLGPDHPRTLGSANNLASLLYLKGDYARAENLYRSVVAGCERTLGPNHPSTLLSLNNLAQVLHVTGDYSGAEALYQRALEGQERVLGQDHPQTLLTVSNLAGLLGNKHEYGRAEPLCRRALAGRERVLGQDHPDTLTSMNNLALLLASRGNHSAAEPLYRRALEAGQRVLGPDHPDTLATIYNLAVTLHAEGDPMGAERLIRQAVGGYERTIGLDHPSALLSVNSLAALLFNKGDYDGAEPLIRRALKGLARISASTGRPHPSLQNFANNYVALLRKTGKSEKEIRERMREFGL